MALFKRSVFGVIFSFFNFILGNIHYSIKILFTRHILLDVLYNSLICNIITQQFFQYFICLMRLPILFFKYTFFYLLTNLFRLVFKFIKCNTLIGEFTLKIIFINLFNFS